MTPNAWAERSLHLLRRSLAIVFVGLVLSSGSRAEEQEKPKVRSIGPDDSTQTSAVVIVPSSMNLAHTAQFLPLDERGSIVGPERAAEQATVVLDRLEAALKAAGSGLDRVVKVNVYAARADVLPTFRTVFKARMTGQARPAVTFVIGVLAHPEALVAIDAIAETPESVRPLAPAPAGQRSGAPLAILPAGARVYVSGQAEPSMDLAEATRGTLKSLGKTLAYLGLDKSHVVQLKAFLEPMSAAAVVEREMTAFFGAGAVPPLVYVEWRSGSTVPIEIELIARAGPRTDLTVVEALTPTGMKASPVFSKVVRVNRGHLVYLSGLYGPPHAKGTEQVEAIFKTLEKLLAETGSDFRHLAKATYYVTDDEASRALNDLRPKYYDAKIPPAASKAIVPGVGADGTTVTLDMIGVTVPIEASPTPPK
ncbi:Enamine deaminase RidA, house cleaning of reactive enamine intermediates, YjgF/YER057c/UK114 family [Singulisphaera sp. GP187]|uniref:RidA family protein n=1 Tax=Singulisphaera sp. GP187 TaxID=1882752 RepID=UPI000927911A|nr:RidA family protein [Singulisphaera sp. GP187]SIO58207.1 Enamine deaminase RidA, house cleaning of reactive enamine intermediates, YjgF/YER057c/UK114 family [Singulisphaera sp. GP187]